MKLIKTTYHIHNTGNDPHPASGLRIALLADFHNGEPEKILDIVREDAPDAIMIPGDVVIGYYPEGNERVIDRCGNIMPFLKGCAETAPTYMSVGNHECLLCDEEFDELRSTGITVLDNDWTFLKTVREHPGRSGSSLPGRILIGGLTSGYPMSYRQFRDSYNRERDGADRVRYPQRRKPRDIGKHPTDSGWLDGFAGEEGYKILLCHHPEYWCLREPMLRERKIDLVLSGHAHGGQWRILGRGILAPNQGLLPGYTSGVHFGPYGRMIISRGLSNPYRFIPRWGNPCEAVYIIFE